LDDKCQQNIHNKTTIGEKAYFIIKYIFCGILFGAYLSTLYAFTQKGKVGIIVGLGMGLLFIFYKNIMIPIKSNKNELGKYTNIIAEIIGVITAMIFVYCK